MSYQLETEQAEMIAELLDVLEPEEFVLWLFQEHPQLWDTSREGHLSPAQTIIRGEPEAVITIIDQLLSGGVV